MKILTGLLFIFLISTMAHSQRITLYRDCEYTGASHNLCLGKSKSLIGIPAGDNGYSGRNRNSTNTSEKMLIDCSPTYTLNLVGRDFTSFDNMFENITFTVNLDTTACRSVDSLRFRLRKVSSHGNGRSADMKLVKRDDLDQLIISDPFNASAGGDHTYLRVNIFDVSASAYLIIEAKISGRWIALMGEENKSTELLLP